MIAIVNVSQPPTRTGPNTYEIRINRDPIFPLPAQPRGLFGSPAA